MATINVTIKCSRRWFFWPLFGVVWLAYRMHIIDLDRAAGISVRGMRLEINR